MPVDAFNPFHSQALSGVCGIILAAGSARRMGRPKQLLPFQGKPLLAHVICQAKAAGLFPLILVLGHEADRIQAALPGLKVPMVLNKAFDTGMASSVIAGLNRLEQTGTQPKGALFLLGDQPLVSAALIEQIVTEAGRHSGKIIVPSFNGNQGNPVYMDRQFFADLMQLDGDIGGRALMQQHPGAVHEMAVSDPSVLRDLDTPEDYDALCRDALP